jgi:hypothetical protein
MIASLWLLSLVPLALAFAAQSALQRVAAASLLANSNALPSTRRTPMGSRR